VLKTVAVVGATGVGKTTTLAKLAAHFAQQGQKRVAMLTLDTFRVAAVDQLKTYSQALKTPLTVANSLKEAQNARRQYRNYDLLLVDTAGRNPRNNEHLRELKSCLEALECETHLVLAAPTKEEDARETIQRFTTLEIDRLLFTKLDETTTFGSLLNLAMSAGIPLSYFTTGQQVPGDIERADGRTLAEALLPSAT
jgi:flagellar biosynthesis protein FlhF